MDDYVDDRRDPVQASYAAAAYLKDAYQEFGDWLLAIASYNCGKSNVEHAIEKAGANDFWSIRQYLPNETRGYVPAFIAMTYVMNYYNKHSIIPQPCARLKAVSRIRVATRSVSSCGPLAMENARVFPSASVSGGSSKVTSRHWPALNVQFGGLSKRNAVVRSAISCLLRSLTRVTGEPGVVLMIPFLVDSLRSDTQQPGCVAA
jgi:hypothetical protein